MTPTPSTGGDAREPDYDAEMRLPEGVTCDQCFHHLRCFAFGYSTPGRTSCDFWPSRYRVSALPADSLGQEETGK